VSEAERLVYAGHFPFAPFGQYGEVQMRKIIACAALAGAILVSACNTVEGVGRDVESAGGTVANAADKSK
jgi:predicted small secreted protein